MVDPLSLIEKLTKHANRIIFLYHNPTHAIIYLSCPIETMWGKKFENTSDSYQEIVETIKKEDRAYVLDMLRQFATEAFNDTITFSIELPDHTYKYLSCNITSLSKENSLEIEWIGGFIEEITHRKEFEKTLYSYSAKKNALLETLEHDIGGHLNLLKNIASSFTDENIQNNLDKLRDYANSIQTLSRYSMEMISNLVKREFIDSSNAPLKMTRINIVASINSILSIFKSAEPLTSKKFQFTSSAEQIFVELDDVKFMQVINNLLYNAIKFTHDGGTISIAVVERESTLFISIADDGIGIPEKFHEKLFEKHSEAARIGLRGEKTNGLGLSIAKKIIELHQGKIWFESKEGEGTNFYIEIPKR